MSENPRIFVSLAEAINATSWVPRETEWLAFVGCITEHKVGPKDGSAFVPGELTGPRRTNASVKSLCLLGLAVDNGARFDDVVARVRALGIEATVTTTASHMKAATSVKRAVFENWLLRNPHGNASKYLEAEVGYLPHLCTGAAIVDADGSDELLIRHTAIEKLRIFAPLPTAWRPDDYVARTQASAAWVAALNAFAALLGVARDPATSDLCRAFYLPRTETPATARSEHVRGRLLTFEELVGPSTPPPAPATTTSVATPEKPSHAASRRFVSTELQEWAYAYRHRFELTAALAARAPTKIRGPSSAEGKTPIECPNASQHTSDNPTSTIAIDASHADVPSFVVKCLHSHCADYDSISSLQHMVSAGWLALDDLYDPAFLCPERSVVAPSRALTDIGNAHRLVDKRGDDLRYVRDWDSWMAWSGNHWEINHPQAVVAAAAAIPRTLLRNGDLVGMGVINPEKEVRRMESRARLEAAVALARCDRRVWQKSQDLNKHPLLFPCRNVTLDLENARVLAHDRAHLMTHASPVVFDVDAVAPVFDRFLQQILPQPALRAYLQRLVGYSLTGLTTEHVFPIFFGDGANGKTTFVEAIRYVLGNFAQQLPVGMLTETRGERHPTEIARLFGARFGFAVETSFGVPLRESLIKALTGGDQMVGRRMHEDYWEFTPTHKLVLVTNHLPGVKGTDEGIWRRIAPVHFSVHVPEADRDRDLPERLRAEAPGILNWAIDGLSAWMRSGLAPPDEVRDAKNSYRASEDLVGRFLFEKCTIDPKLEVKASAIYAAFSSWCDDNGERAWTQKSFGTDLQRRGFGSRAGTGNVTIRVGLALSPERRASLRTQ